MSTNSIQHTIDILFTGTNEISGTLDSIASDLSSFAGGVEDFASPFAEAGNSVVKLNALIAGGTVAAISLAAFESGKFRDQMHEINTLTQLDEAGFAAFSEDILTAAQELKGSDIAGLQTSVYNAVSLGVADYADAIKVSLDAEKLAIAGKADLNESLEFLLGTMNAYGDGVEDAGRYSDAFFTIVQDGKTTIPELSASMADVTGIAAAGKVPIETVGAAIAALTAAGVPTAQAITKIKSAMEGMIAPSDGAKKAAAALGVELSASALASKGFDGVLRDIQAATGGSVEKMSELFTSTEGLQAALTLGADKSGVFAKALEDMKNKAGATDKAFSEMSKNTDLAFQKLSNTFKALRIRAGNEMSMMDVAVISALTKMIKSMSEAVKSGTFDPLFDDVNEFKKRFSFLLTSIAAALPEALAGVDFAKLSESFADIQQAVGGMFDGLNIGSIDGLRETIQTAIDAVSGLITVGAGIVDAWTPVVEMIGGLISWFSEMDQSTQNSIGNLLGFSQQAVVVAGGLGTIAAAVGGLSAITGSAGAGLVALAGPAALGAVSLAAGAAAGSLLRDYVPAVDDAAQAMIGWVDELTNFSGTQGDAIEASEIAAKRITETAEAIELIPEYKEITVEISKETAEKNLQELEQSLEGGGVLVIDAAISEEFKAEAEAAQLAFENLPVGLSLDEFLPQVDTLISYVPKSSDYEIVPYIDERKAEYARGYLEEVMPDGSLSFTWVGEVDKPALDKAAADIKKAIPEDKILRIQTDLQIAQIKADSEQVEALLKYKAEVDTAEAEAAAARVQSAFESVNTGINSTGGLIESLFGDLGDYMGSSLNETQARWQIQDQLEKENSLRERTISLQEKLTQEQIKYMEARRQKMENGDPLISVEANNLSVPLEMIFIEILEAVQLRANQEGLEALIGL